MLELHLNLDGILADHRDFGEELEHSLIDGASKLSIMTHAHVIDEAREKLKGSSKQYILIENLELDDSEKDQGTFYVRILHPAVWIEDGLPNNFDMLPGFLASPKVKTNSKGEKYFIVPFKHNKEPHMQSGRQKIMADTIKNELRKQGIPYKKIEKNPDGSPKLGLLHKFNINDPQQKHQVNPPHQGPQGAPWQAHHKTQGQEGPGGRPYLWQTRIYQQEHKDATTGAVGVQRNIMTFRIAHEKHSGKKWLHSGMEGSHFLTEAKDWAEKTWDTDIVPAILKEFGIENG